MAAFSKSRCGQPPSGWLSRPPASVPPWASIMALPCQHGRRQTFPKPAIGDPPPLRWPHPEQSLENGAACQDEIGAVAADARLGHALLVGAGEQGVGHRVRVGRIEPTAIDAASVVARKAEHDACNCCDRARRPEKVRAALVDPFAKTVLCLERCQKSR